jgi:lipoprotein
MKSTASRSPFQSSAIAVALASSLFALTACGGGGDSSTTSGAAGSAAGGATAVASNTQGSSGTGNGTASSGAQQGQGTAGSGTQQVPDAVASSALQGLGTADSSAQQGLGAAGSSLDLGPGNGPSNSAAQAAAWSGKGIGTEFARRIHATCPTFGVMSGGWGSKTTVSSILSCVAGSYAGTDLWTGQRCEVNIAANGDVRASRGGRAFRPFSASELGDYSWKDGAFRIQLRTEGRKVANSLDEEAESVALLFDPVDALGARKFDRDGWTLLVGQLDENGNRINEQRAREEWLDDPESSRLIQKMGDYLLVEVVHEAEEMSRDDLIWCAIPR